MVTMKKIGIVGGVSWRSTAQYYAGICRCGEAWHRAHSLPGIPSPPEMVIESLSLARAVAYLEAADETGSWLEFDVYHHAALRHLETSGADVALIASNTPHDRFDEIVRGIQIPVIDIFEAAAGECARIDAPQVLILGTSRTMASMRCRSVFGRCGIRADAPSDESQRRATIALLEELQLGSAEEAAPRVEAIARAAWKGRPGRPVVCLACTELPLAFPDVDDQTVFERNGIRYVHTSAVHIAAACSRAMDG